MYNAITDVEGILVGHASDTKALTGCSVVLCQGGAVGGIDLRGTATGTRQLDPLHTFHLVEKVDGIFLSGGSAFGLDAAGGVMKYLEEKGIGFDVGITKVPTVPTAIIFDLHIGDQKVRPDGEMGYKACLSATDGDIGEGSVGVGIGATVGKLFGMERAMKGGMGTASLFSPQGLVVGVLVVVNAFGDVIDYKSGKIIAGTRDLKEGLNFVDTAKKMREGIVKKAFLLENTTLGIVATNAKLTKAEAQKVAQMSHIGLAKCISPVNSTFDGDIIFALSMGEIKADINTIGLMAEKAICEAIRNAIIKADGFGIIPAYKDLKSQ